MVARHPMLTLFITSWIAAIACYGVQFTNITTDPVEIWAAPSSQSRREKDYFDSTFGPFYRTEQIFLKSKRLHKVFFISAIRCENYCCILSFNNFS